MTTTTTLNAFNEKSAKVINYMQGGRTTEQLVGEYFGLRKEAVYSDDGETIEDYINDFKDESILKAKGVYLSDRLIELGVTEEKFASLFSKVPSYAKVRPTTGGDTKGEGEEDSDGVDGSVEAKPTLPNTKKGTTKASK